MVVINKAKRLTGLEPLAYMGVEPVTPTQFVTNQRDPTVNDWQNFDLGAEWLNTVNEDVWKLVSLQNNQATWVLLTGGAGSVTDLRADDGNIATPLGGVINVLGPSGPAGVINTTVPSAHTLQINLNNALVLETLTGNTGGAVSPLAGNINVVGDAVGITIAGNPGTHTLTASLIGGGTASESYLLDDASVITPNPATGQVIVHGVGGATTLSGGAHQININASATPGAESFPTDSGTATPNGSGVLNIKTQQAILGSGSSVLFSAPGPSNTVQFNITDANANTLVGNLAGNLTLSGTNNTGLGKSILSALTTGSSNTVIGQASGTGITTGSSNTFIGNANGSNYASNESNNIIVGSQTGKVGEIGAIRIGNTGGGSGNNGNIFIGQDAGNNTYTLNSPTQGVRNTIVGNGSLTPLTTGTDNTGSGYLSLQNLTTGIANTSYGAFSGRAITSGFQNNLLGYQAGTGLTTGINNVGIGTNALGLMTTGQSNVAIGVGAMAATGAESYNIFIGGAAPFNSIGQIGDSNTIGIGYQTGNGAFQTNRCFIQGIAGITTAVNDAIPVLISASTSQLGTVSSSARYKQNIQEMGNYSAPIMLLEPVTFEYKQDASKKTNVGLIAEEVEEVMPSLVVYKDDQPETIKYHDLPVLLLNELKKLARRVTELEQQLK